MSNLDKYIHESSGWIVKTVQSLQVHTIDYRPLAASSFVELPFRLKRSRALLNIRNNDDRCFIYCILAKLHPDVPKPEHVSSYKSYEKELNVIGLKFPMTLTQIDRFERLNKSISVNVFGFDGSDIIPLKITKHTRRRKHVNLLLFSHQNVTHYCLIRDFDLFLKRTKKHHDKFFFCYYCLNSFTKRQLMLKHAQFC